MFLMEENIFNMSKFQHCFVVSGQLTYYSLVKQHCLISTPHYTCLHPQRNYSSFGKHLLNHFKKLGIRDFDIPSHIPRKMNHRY